MGYDISASASSSSSATSGPVQFGNVKGGSIGLPTWAIVSIVAAAVVGFVAFLLLKK